MDIMVMFADCTKHEYTNVCNMSDNKCVNGGKIQR
jgi:hypothetical protein